MLEILVIVLILSIGVFLRHNLYVFFTEIRLRILQPGSELSHIEMLSFESVLSQDFFSVILPIRKSLSLLVGSFELIELPFSFEISHTNAILFSGLR